MDATPTPTLTISPSTINMQTQQTTFTCQVTYSSSEPSITYIRLSLNTVGGSTVAWLFWYKQTNYSQLNVNLIRIFSTVR